MAHLYRPEERARTKALTKVLDARFHAGHARTQALWYAG